MSVVVSVRVPRELKEEAERLGIRVSEVLRRALEEEVRRRRLELLSKELDKVSEVLEKINVKRFVRHVREDREGR